jgi:hypothetical protein
MRCGIIFLLLTISISSTFGQNWQIYLENDRQYNDCRLESLVDSSLIIIYRRDTIAAPINQIDQIQYKRQSLNIIAGSIGCCVGSCIGAVIGANLTIAAIGCHEIGIPGMLIGAVGGAVLPALLLNKRYDFTELSYKERCQIIDRLVASEKRK